MKSFSKVLTLVFLIIVSVIGAGFSSGKEIQLYFFNNIKLAAAMIAFTFVLFNFCFNLFLNFGKECNAKTFSEVSGVVFKKKKNIFDVFLIFCFFIVIAAMLAGTDAMMSSYKIINISILSLITAFLCICISIGGFKNIARFANLCVPVMIFFIVVTIGIFLNHNTNMVKIDNFNLIYSVAKTFVYVGMNMLFAGLILFEVGKNYTKTEIKFASLIASAILSILIFLFTLMFNYAGSDVLNASMPLLYVGFKINSVWGIMISVVIWLAVFSSIITLVYVVANMLKKHINSYAFNVVLTVSVSFAISIFGFDIIVKYLYPITGLIGLFFIISLSFKTKHKKISNLNKNIK